MLLSKTNLLDPEPVIPKVSSLVFWAKDKIYSEGVEDTVTPLITEKLPSFFIDCNSSICKLCKEIKDKFPEKKIWLYSGYQYESLSSEQFKVLLFVDVLVDGRYDETLKNPSLKFRGSSNQRVINIPETLKQNKVILYCD